jgi:outer membrane protein assembly factor BamE
MTAPITRLCFPLAFLTLAAACSSAPDVTSRLTPYRVDVRQGNFVSQEMVAQLKPGLTRDQVRFLLGTPLIVDVFHADRWDYSYRFEPGRGEVQHRLLTVFFEDGKLIRVSGDVVADAAKANETTPQQPSARMIDIKPDAGAVPKTEDKNAAPANTGK